MTVLVTGAGGQIGRAALRELGDRGVGLRHAELDVTDAAAVRAAFSWARHLGFMWATSFRAC